jgi:hypothetical protein
LAGGPLKKNRCISPPLENNRTKVRIVTEHQVLHAVRDPPRVNPVDITVNQNRRFNDPFHRGGTPTL